MLTETGDKWTRATLSGKTGRVAFCFGTLFHRSLKLFIPALVRRAFAWYNNEATGAKRGWPSRRLPKGQAAGVLVWGMP